MSTSRYKEEALLQILRGIAPGTPLRDAINNIVDLRHGGLLVIANDDKAQAVVRSGFELRTKLTPQRLVELSKMDRAIVIDEDMQTILYANAYLVPDPEIPSEETGTRHLTAEKVARQLGVAAIAISATRGRVTVYYGLYKHLLQDTITLTARANQALRILEQYRATFDDFSRELTALEFEGRVLPYHIANLVQTIMQMLAIQDEIEQIFVELGEEKELMELQLDWLMLDVRDAFVLMIRDFQANDRSPEKIIAEIQSLSPEELLSTERVMEALGYEAEEEALDVTIASRGYRVLSQIPRIPISVIENVADEFHELQNILDASEEELMEVKGVAEVRARAIRLGLQRLKRSLLLWE
ncbi:MAG: DNA integrity scanning protein DisA [Candidatus Fraserbacteria bacterium RBG_16_55_9]|uniref:DNA integrity scanning protein DisA n=1 Tax=Fraserbacteria sp. (strain RBG_16_55_9) TaxID=1817864 RepID=A0A1F5UYF6_FRAXR|nr:MAG: DNA integrity scanning protein DisA [Candidatus Fraserbacteria bacterium RBG_16_55_9]